jgi:hypothetical protein
MVKLFLINGVRSWPRALWTRVHVSRVQSLGKPLVLALRPLPALPDLPAILW